MPAGASTGGLVVLVPGGGWQTADPTGLEPLARGLAGDGYAAATVTYRAAAVGAHYPVPVADILCGAASAVAQARARGHPATRLILLGHSAGGQLALLAALHPQGFRSPCADPAVTPDAVVTLAGAFDLRDIAEPLFGLPQQAGPDLWHQGDVVTWATERPSMPVLLLHGSADTLVPPHVTQDVAAALRAAGHPTYVEVLPDVDHTSIYRPKVILPVLLSWLARQTATRNQSAGAASGSS